MAEDDMGDEILLPGDGGRETRKRVTPINQMPFGELNNGRVAGDFESDQEIRQRAKERLVRLVDTAQQIGIFEQIDTAAQDVLAQSGSFGQAADNLARSRQDVMRVISEQTRYRNTPELAGLAETEISLLVDSFRLAEDAQTLDIKGASAEDRESYNKRLAGLEKRRIRESLSFNPADFLGRNISNSDPIPQSTFPPEAQESLEQILEEIRRQTKIHERAEPEILRISAPEEKDKEHAWVAVVFDQIEMAELATRESQHVSYDTDIEKTWKAIERFIVEQVPDGMGRRHDELSAYYGNEYPRGVYLKERLVRYTKARQRLNDRFIETQKSQGGLTGYGVNTSELIQIEKIAPSLNDLEPGDMYLIVHSDEVFQMDLLEVSRHQTFDVALENGKSLEAETREILGNVDAGMKLWYQAGRRYDKPLRKGWPTFKDALNSDAQWRHLQSLVQEICGSRSGGTLAYHMLEATATMPFFDKDRESFQGNGELRDTMHKERHRVDNLVKGKITPGDAVYTTGRYFAVEGQDNKTPREYKAEPNLLEVNARRAVFPAESLGYKAELVGDFWQTITYRDLDRMILPLEHRHKSLGELYQEGLVDSSLFINRKLISYVVDRNGEVIGSFKDIPLLNLGKNTYVGYFQYNLNLASRINGVLYKTVGVVKGSQADRGVIGALQSVDYWNELDKSIIDIPKSCPKLNTPEFNARGALIREKLEKRGWLTKDEINSVGGVTSYEDVKLYSVVTTADRIRARKTATDEAKISGVSDPRIIADRAREIARERVDIRRRAILDVINTPGFEAETRTSQAEAKAWADAQLNEIRLTKAVDILWEGSARRVKPMSEWHEFNRETPIRNGLGEAAELKKILKAIRRSGFVTGEWYNTLVNEEVPELRFGPVRVAIPERR